MKRISTLLIYLVFLISCESSYERPPEIMPSLIFPTEIKTDYRSDPNTYISSLPECESETGTPIADIEFFKDYIQKNAHDPLSLHIFSLSSCKIKHESYTYVKTIIDFNIKIPAGGRKRDLYTIVSHNTDRMMFWDLGKCLDKNTSERLMLFVRFYCKYNDNYFRKKNHSLK